MRSIQAVRKFSGFSDGGLLLDLGTAKLVVRVSAGEPVPARPCRVAFVIRGSDSASALGESWCDGIGRDPAAGDATAGNVRPSVVGVWEPVRDALVTFRRAGERKPSRLGFICEEIKHRRARAVGNMREITSIQGTCATRNGQSVWTVGKGRLSRGLKTQ